MSSLEEKGKNDSQSKEVKKITVADQSRHSHHRPVQGNDGFHAAFSKMHD